MNRKQFILHVPVKIKAGEKEMTISKAFSIMTDDAKEAQQYFTACVGDLYGKKDKTYQEAVKNVSYWCSRANAGDEKHIREDVRIRCVDASLYDDTVIVASGEPYKFPEKQETEAKKPERKRKAKAGKD